MSINLKGFSKSIKRRFDDIDKKESQPILSLSRPKPKPVTKPPQKLISPAIKRQRELEDKRKEDEERKEWEESEASDPKKQKIEETFKPNFVYKVIINPAPEKVKSSQHSYVTEEDVVRICKECAGKDVFIRHNRFFKDGQSATPAGKVIRTYLDSQKRIVGELMLNGTKRGRLLAYWMGEPHYKTGEVLQEHLWMKEVSLGMKVDLNLKTVNGSTKVETTKSATEVSVCWKGDKDGTYVLERIPVDLWLKKIKEDRIKYGPPPSFSDIGKPTEEDKLKELLGIELNPLTEPTPVVTNTNTNTNTNTTNNTTPTQQTPTQQAPIQQTPLISPDTLEEILGSIKKHSKKLDISINNEVPKEKENQIKNNTIETKPIDNTDQKN